MKIVLIYFTFFIILIIKINTLKENIFQDKESNENSDENLIANSKIDNDFNIENRNNARINNIDLNKINSNLNLLL